MTYYPDKWLTLPEGCDLKEERILLHCCCAPCSAAILEWMVEAGLRPGIFFSNSNIVPLEEYELRRSELERYAGLFGLEVADDEYDHSAWLDYVSASLSRKTGCGDPASFPERGERCLECFRYRLGRAARYALDHGYTVLTTTLASSRWKDLGQVDEAGRNAVEEALAAFRARETGPGRTEGQDKDARLLWWGQNWRRGGLQERRACIIREQSIYNQEYCGCEFSAGHGRSIEGRCTLARDR